MIPSADIKEPILWQTYVSWNQFAWLYVMGLFTGLRGALLWQGALPGWKLWGLGASALVLLAVILRYWVRYEATGQRLLINNALTGREIESLSLEHVADIAIRQSLMAGALGIGTIVFRSTSGEALIEFRGVSDPESTLQHIRTVRRRRIFPSSSQIVFWKAALALRCVPEDRRSAWSWRNGNFANGEQTAHRLSQR